MAIGCQTRNKQTMRITQAYISESVGDFAWLENYNLLSYYDSLEPCIFFGQYRQEDWDAVSNHKGMAIIFWCGMDSKYVEDFEIYKKENIYHITPHYHVYNYLKSKSLNIIKLKSGFLYDTKFTGKYGPNIFAYCPMTAPDYHRFDIIESLINMGYPIIIGDGSIPQKDWHNGIKYKYYDQCYIGLVLNDYAGGGSTIMELAQQGKYVISNTKLFNNCLEWNSIDDIIEILEKYKFKKPDSIFFEFQELHPLDPKWLYLDFFK
jgi:hypothetical protein